MVSEISDIRISVNIRVFLVSDIRVQYPISETIRKSDIFGLFCILKMRYVKFSSQFVGLIEHIYHSKQKYLPQNSYL